MPEVKYRTATVPSFAPNASTNEGGPGGDPIDDKPTYVKQWADTDGILPRGTRPGLARQQLRALLSVDDLVDALMKELSDRGEERDTLAFFLSDNGYLWREHGVAEREQPDLGHNEFQPPGVGLGGKGKPYKQSVMVPLLMRWPDMASLSNAADHRLVANIDLAPTALDAAALTVPPGKEMDGTSLFGSSSRNRILFEGLNWASIWGTDGPYGEYEYTKYESDGFQEYYALGSGRDPLQLHNLFGGDGQFGTADDATSTEFPFSTPPNPASLSGDLDRYKDCANDGSGSGPCP
jgi:hypothetical protein